MKNIPRKRALILGLFIFVMGCAQTPERKMGPEGGLINPVTGETMLLIAQSGKLQILDICASWSTACLVNARVMSEVCEVLCDRDDVFIASVLLDENDEGRAYHAYKKLMKLNQEVRYADISLIAGGSILGPLKNIPRLVILDKEGSIAEDITGGMLNAAGVIRRALEILGEETLP